MKGAISKMSVNYINGKPVVSNKRYDFRCLLCGSKNDVKLVTDDNDVFNDKPLCYIHREGITLGVLYIMAGLTILLFFIL